MEGDSRKQRISEFGSSIGMSLMLQITVSVKVHGLLNVRTELKSTVLGKLPTKIASTLKGSTRLAYFVDRVYSTVREVCCDGAIPYSRFKIEQNVSGQAIKI